VKKPKSPPKWKSPMKYESEQIVTEEEDDDSQPHTRTQKVCTINEKDESVDGYYTGYKYDF